MACMPGQSFLRKFLQPDDSGYPPQGDELALCEAVRTAFYSVTGVEPLVDKYRIVSQRDISKARLPARAAAWLNALTRTMYLGEEVLKLRALDNERAGELPTDGLSDRSESDILSGCDGLVHEHTHAAQSLDETALREAETPFGLLLLEGVTELYSQSILPEVMRQAGMPHLADRLTRTAGRSTAYGAAVTAIGYVIAGLAELANEDPKHVLQTIATGHPDVEFRALLERAEVAVTGKEAVRTELLKEEIRKTLSPIAAEVHSEDKPTTEEHSPSAAMGISSLRSVSSLLGQDPSHWDGWEKQPILNRFSNVVDLDLLSKQNGVVEKVLKLQMPNNYVVRIHSSEAARVLRSDLGRDNVTEEDVRAVLDYIAELPALPQGRLLDFPEAAKIKSGQLQPGIANASPRMDTANAGGLA